jgi:hypothetical protein
VPDEKKGAQLLLFTKSDAVTREATLERVRSLNLTELTIPRNIIKLDQLPVLGTGKTDYVKLNQVAMTQKNVWVTRHSQTRSPTIRFSWRAVRIEKILVLRKISKRKERPHDGRPSLSFEFRSTIID